MGLFNLGKKKKSEFEAVPLYYWEEQSYMMAIPRHMDEEIFSGAGERINAIPGVHIKEVKPPTEKEPIRFVITYDGEEYSGGMYTGGFKLPEMWGKQNYYFSQKEWEELQKANEALTVFLKFNEDAKKSFHLQLKLVAALVPDLLGVMDESAERMLCARWVKLAAASDVTPGPSDMFVVQAVGGKDGSVWLHSHGLCRCGLTELEIVDSDSKHYNNHYNIINTFASMMLDKKEKFIPRTTSFYLGVLSNNQPVVATCVPWTEGIKEYPKLEIGGPKDRADGHNSSTSLIFLYVSEEDEKNQKLTKVSVYDDFWGENPIFFFSNEETDRMRRLARERFSFVRKAYEKGNRILIKIGLPVDNQKEKANEFEHIWFELNEFDGERFRATLTQEPYNVSDIHAGDERWFTIEDVTDWLIYTEEYAVTSDKAYLLVD